ncbi:MAG: hypothetical protein ACKVS9_01795 [Phycisphaerae bacterium]
MSGDDRRRAKAGAAPRQTAAGGWPLVVVLAAFAVHFYFFSHQINDDAFITFRYSLNLAEGRGAIFNEGEYVEGYSNFLLMLIVAAAIKVGGPEAAMPTAKAISFVAAIVALIASAGLCRAWLRRSGFDEIAARRSAWIAPAMVVASSAFAMNCTTGLETALFSACLPGGLWLHERAVERGRWCGSGAAFGLAALTRPEGVMVFGVFIAARVVGMLVNGAQRPSAVYGGQRPPAVDAATNEERSRARLRSNENSRGRLSSMLLDVLVGCAMIAAHLAFRRMYYGEWVPNTYFAKVGGFDWGTAPVAYLAEFFGYSLLGVLPLLAFVPLVMRGCGSSAAVLPALLVVLATVAGVVRTGSDWMPGSRLLVPYLPVWTALVVTGLAMAARARRNGAPRPSAVLGEDGAPRPSAVLVEQPPSIAIVGAILVLVIFAVQTPLRGWLFEYVSVRAVGYENGHAGVGRHLRASANPGETVALMDIGIIGFMNPELRVLDISGLTDRHIAKSPGVFLRKEYDVAYALDHNPAYFVIALLASGTPHGIDLVTLRPWLPIEVTLLDHPKFVAHYIRPRAVAAKMSPLDQLAAICGAERVFEHDYPDEFHYFLAVYRFDPVARDMLTPAHAEQSRAETPAVHQNEPEAHSTGSLREPASMPTSALFAPTSFSFASVASTQPVELPDMNLTPLEALRRAGTASEKFCPICKKGHPGAFVHGPERN